MLPVYRQLLEEDIKILVYSGDVDAIVPGQQPCQQPPGQVCQPAASKHACADGNGSMVYCWEFGLFTVFRGSKAVVALPVWPPCLPLAVIGTRRWIRQLDLPVKSAWRPWRSTTGQVRFGSIRALSALPFRLPLFDALK
jgi:hypothetical protein